MSRSVLIGRMLLAALILGALMAMGLVAGIATGALGDTDAAGDENNAVLTARLHDLSQRMDEIVVRLDAVERDLGHQEINLDDLRTTIDVAAPTEDIPGTLGPPNPDASRGSSDASMATGDLTDERRRQHDPRYRRVSWESLDLLRRTLREGIADPASPEEQARFWELARTTDLLPQMIEQLQSDVEADLLNVDAHLALADAYVAKLLTIPLGPERGIWGGKAEAEWQAILDADPDHWGAQYALAYNYGKYPDFLEKTADAIDGFEQARQIQEQHHPVPQQIDTYLELARLYLKQGDTDAAMEALEAGLARHPGDPRLEDARRRVE